MANLANFPMVSQLTAVTGDGRPSENAQFDCVPASIDAACRWLLGKPENSVFNPDNFKDTAYGETLRNSGTSAIKYMDFCKSLGIHLYAVENANYAHAIQTAHQCIQENKPVIFTRDDPYVDQTIHPDWTHVCVFFSEDAGGLTALDPYIGRPVYKTDSGWIGILRNSELWVAERISTMSTPSGWHDDGTTLTAPNGVKVVHGFRLKVLEGWHPDNWPLGAEYNTASLEDSNKSLGAGDQQVFRFSMLGWTQARGVFEEYLGVELEYARAQLAKAYNLNQQLQAQVAALQAQQGQPQGNPSVQQQLDAALQKLAQIKAVVG